MSFARLTHNSDVYVYDDVSGGYTCCFCRLQPHAEQFNVPTATAMIEHLWEHKKRGDKVPVYCLEGLADEIENGR